MSNPDGVLAAIDACLDDYTLSDDAMRWAPDEPDPTPQSIPLADQIARFVEQNTDFAWTDWQRHYLNALTPAVDSAAQEPERCPACSCPVTEHPWEGGAMGGYVCSRSLFEPPSCRRCRWRQEQRVMPEVSPLEDLASRWPMPDSSMPVRDELLRITMPDLTGNIHRVASVTPGETFGEYVLALEPAVAAFADFADGVQRAAQVALEGFGKVFGPVLSITQAAMHKATYRDNRKHIRRCLTCNPRGFRKPLPINGQEYHRRQRRRNRR